MKNVLNKKGEQFKLLSKIGELWGWRLSPSELSEGEKAILFKHSYHIGVKAFIQKYSSEIEEDIYGHLFKEDKLFIITNINCDSIAEQELFVMAFLTCRDINFNGKKILYLSGICVDPLYQGYGIIGNLINEAYKRGERYDIMALRTQNPVMKQCFDKCIGGKSHPDSRIKLPREVEEVGAFIAKLLEARNYQVRSFIMKGVYGSCLYGTEPFSRDEFYNDQFSKLNKLAGDSMLCIKIMAQ